MLIEKNISLPASVKEVWSKIEDMEGIIKCMPGIEKVEAAGENKWHAVMKQKIGFISATFDADIGITSWKPPTHLELAADATARRGLGKVFQTLTLDLIPASERETTAKYRAEISLSGTMGTFGQKVLGGKADQIASQFSQAFIARLTGK